MREHWFDTLAVETAGRQSRWALLRQLRRGLAGALLAATGLGAGRAPAAKGKEGGVLSGSNAELACDEKCLAAWDTCTVRCVPLTVQLTQGQAAERAARQAYERADCGAVFVSNPAICTPLAADLAAAIQAVAADEQAIKQCAQKCTQKESACFGACRSQHKRP